MKDNIIYLGVRVASGSGEHIGTIKLNTIYPKELTGKVKTACLEHFDADAELNIPELNYEDYINGNRGEVSLKLDDYNETIEIYQTWLY